MKNGGPSVNDIRNKSGNPGVGKPVRRSRRSQNWTKKETPDATGTPEQAPTPKNPNQKREKKAVVGEGGVFITKRKVAGHKLTVF